MDRREYDRRLEAILPALFQDALKRTRHWQNAEDLVQDTALRGLTKLDQLREVKSFEGWLFTIQRSISFRRRDCGLSMPLEMAGYEHDDVPDREALPSSSNLIYAYASAICSAPLQTQRTILAGLGTDKSRLHVAGRLGLSPEAVGKRQQNWINWLRKQPPDPFRDAEHPVGKMRPLLERTERSWSEEFAAREMDLRTSNPGRVLEPLFERRRELIREAAASLQALPVSVDMYLLAWEPGGPLDAWRDQSKGNEHQARRWASFALRNRKYGMQDLPVAFHSWFTSYGGAKFATNRLRSSMAAWSSIRKCPTPDPLSRFLVQALSRDAMSGVVDSLLHDGVSEFEARLVIELGTAPVGMTEAEYEERFGFMQSPEYLKERHGIII